MFYYLSTLSKKKIKYILSDSTSGYFIKGLVNNNSERGLDHQKWCVSIANLVATLSTIFIPITIISLFYSMVYLVRLKFIYYLHNRSGGGVLTPEKYG